MTALFFVLLATAAAGAEPPVAVVGGDAIGLAAVDGRCGEPCAALVGELREKKAATLDLLVGEALLAGGPPVDAPAVSETAVDEFMASHAADFHGPPARDRAAARFFLAREGRRQAEQARIAAERARRPVRMHVPPDILTAAPETVLAEVAGRRIRDRDVEARAGLPLFRLRGLLARERRRAADELVGERLWQREAAARGVDAAALRAEVRARAAPVTDADIDRYYETEVRPRTPGLEKRPERIRPLLEFRATSAAEEVFLEGARARHPVRVTLAEPRPPRLTLGAGHGGWHGPRDAPVKVVFLTGYRDRVSRAVWPAVRDVARDRGTAVAVRPLIPLWDPEATLAAAAVRCAADHGRQWIVHDAVASAGTLPDRTALEAIAADAGVPAAPFMACLDRAATTAAVGTESAEAERLGLDEPPAVLVDGAVLGGMQDAAAIRRAMRAARRTP